MHYSLSEPDILIEKTGKLLDSAAVRIVDRQGGGNSVVYCMEAGQQKYAVKSYPPYAPDQRDRLAAELMVYQFLNAHQVPAVPQLKTYSEADRLLVIDWIDGEVPVSHTDHDVEQAIQFLHSVCELNELPAAQELPLAAEACLSLTILINQIKKRLQRLQDLPNEPQLKNFLSDRFQPVLAACIKRAMQGYRDNNMAPDEELPYAQRSLIPADFGFHNSIRDKSGKLHFFDFDYFGWDDPVKLLADILWHPKMQLSALQVQRFIQGITALYSSDLFFLQRFQLVCPLFGLRWALIFLNEFIPAFWQNRQHADGLKRDQVTAKLSQLERADALLSRIQQEHNYDNITATGI